MKKVLFAIFFALITASSFAQSFTKVTAPNQIYGNWKTTIDLSAETAAEMLSPELNSLDHTAEVKLTLHMMIENAKAKGITTVTNSSEITFILFSNSEFPAELIETFETRYKKKLYQLYEISTDKKSIKIKTRKMSEKFKYTDREFLASTTYISSDKKTIKMDFSGDGSNFVEFKKVQ